MKSNTMTAWHAVLFNSLIISICLMLVPLSGMSLHSINEGEMRQCSDCHGGREAIHLGTSIEPLFVEDYHDNLACQVCHIPAIARAISTKTDWY